MKFYKFLKEVLSWWLGRIPGILRFSTEVNFTQWLIERCFHRKDWHILYAICPLMIVITASVCAKLSVLPTKYGPFDTLCNIPAYIPYDIVNLSFKAILWSISIMYDRIWACQFAMDNIQILSPTFKNRNHKRGRINFLFSNW